MCGINGLFNRYQAPVDPAVIRRMCDVLAHRGPDGEGLFTEGPVGLGHRRLAIIDLAGGDQPMKNEDGRLVVVFNGEIYNYLELRRDLAAFGHQFRTSSDTEVILHAYEQWGMECVSHFNGMWAFALWDGVRRGLFLSRDRIGEKPLYYHDGTSTFAFASEIKSLEAAGVKLSADLSWLSVFLSLGYLPAPATFYRNVMKLEAGCSLWVDERDRRYFRYWSLPDVSEAEMERDQVQAGRRFQEIFQDAVRLRMHADVPYGAFLSGGLDSSSVVGVMASISEGPVHTFTVGFPDREFDERPLARLVARRFGTDHREELLSGTGFMDNLRRVLRCYDEPFGDSSAIPTGMVAQFARRHVKTALSGDGGDEVLSGYPSYQVEKGLVYYQKSPRLLRAAAGAGLAAIRPLFRGRAVYLWNRVARMRDTLDSDFIDRLMTKTFYMPAELLRSLTEGCGAQVDPAGLIRDRLPIPRARHSFYRLMHFHFALSLPDDMLAKVDRMSMSHSLEVRLPFLDHRLVEFTAVLHKDVKMRFLERKSLLRRTEGLRLPGPVRRGSKRGFVVPLREWFKDDSFHSHLDALNGLEEFGFRCSVLSRLIKEHVSAQKDHGQVLWMLLLIREWLNSL